jgi:hypothetical protein
MRTTAALVCLSLSVLVPSEAAIAKGCIKGAIVGGVAGHYAGHHGVIGAIGGCLYGRHLAHQNQGTAKRYSPDHYDGRGWL